MKNKIKLLNHFLRIVYSLRSRTKIINSSKSQKVIILLLAHLAETLESSDNIRMKIELV